MDDKKHSEVAMVLGRVPSGIFILTARDGAGRETGMLCSWVQQVAFSPPLISVVIRNDRYVNEWIERTGKAAINIVGESQKHFLSHFGRGFKIDDPAFEGIETARSPLGLPVLTEALGYLECRAVAKYVAADHFMHLLEVVSAGTGEMLHEEQPMVHIRKNGLNY